MPELGVHQRTCNINVMEDSKFDVLGQWQPWRQLLPSVCTCHGKNKIQRMMADGQGSYEAWCGPGPVFVSKLLFYHNVYTMVSVLCRVELPAMIRWLLSHNLVA